MRTDTQVIPQGWQSSLHDWRMFAATAAVATLVAYAAPSYLLRSVAAAFAIAALIQAAVVVRAERKPGSVRGRVIACLPAVSWLGDVPLMAGRQIDAAVGGFVRDRVLTTAMHAIAARLPGAARRECRKILFTSPGSRDGKTTVALNTAAALAKTHRVLLIDANLRNPSLSRSLNLATYDGGLCELVRRAAPYRSCLALTGTPNLHVIRSGSLPADPAEILNSARLARTLQLSTRYYDRVIIDSPPLCDYPDAAKLAAVADDVVLVVNAQKPGFDQVTQAHETLKRVNANVVGFVLNRVSG